MNESQMTIEDMENWCLTIKAREKFYAFIDAVKSNEGLLDVCQELYQRIDDIVLNKEREQFIKKLNVGERYYRARIVKVEDDKRPETGIGKNHEGKFTGYNEVNSREPIIGISGEGRNNVAGAAYLYVASNSETACMEIKSQLGDLISLATFELNKPMEIIDFATEKEFRHEDTVFHDMNLGEFFTLLMFTYCEPIREYDAYRATQIISDYLRKTGVDGISYKSFLSPGGVNYTFFNSHPDRIKFCDSRILLHKQANHSFWDLNNDVEIMSNRTGTLLNYNEKIANKHKEHLKLNFQFTDK